MAELADFIIDPIAQSRIEQIDFDNLKFGSTFSDHMFVMDYVDGEWVNPTIMPFKKLEFAPSLATLHYGQAIFEGLKAFRSEANNEDILVFRPEMHAKRLNRSGERLCIPKIDEKIFTEAINQLVKIDANWVSGKPGNSLYIRPVVFATDEFLGVAPSQTYKFIIMTSPVSSYYAGNVKVLVEREYVRAAEGGTGYIKSGGNYSGSLLPAKKALEKGYHQLLWTDSKEHKYIEESGTMNVMFQIEDTIITPALTSSILAGVTRNSILELADKWGYKFEERRVSVDEVINAIKEGKLKDAFGTGTAATITHIDTIHCDGIDYQIPSDSPREFSTKAGNYLDKLKVGLEEDELDWMMKIR